MSSRIDECLDAARWAKDFIAAFPQEDEKILLRWFSYAVMIGRHIEVKKMLASLEESSFSLDTMGEEFNGNSNHQ